MKTSPILLRIILFTILILSVNQALSQSKFVLSGGLGEPEFYHLKIKYGQNFQVGLVIGGYVGHGLFGSDNIIFQGSYAAEIIYHFSGVSKYVEQVPWYILGGLGYYDIPISGWYGTYDIGFYPRIGRTLNFSKRIGIDVDLGIFLPLSASSGNPYDFKVFPSGSIGLFIRL